MKKQLKLTILAIMLGFASLTTSGQGTFKKSDKFVEGTVSYTKASNTKASWSFAPTVGYFLTDKFAVGVSGSFGEILSVKTTNFGAFGRCNFLKLGKSGVVYSQLNVATQSQNTSGVKITSFKTDLGLGANYFVTNRLALTAGLTSLVSYQKQGSSSLFSIGFTGVDNPLALGQLGVLYKF